MTFAVNGFPSSTSFTPMLAESMVQDPQALASAPIGCRKRKDMEEEQDDIKLNGHHQYDRPSAVKDLRQFSKMSRGGDEEALFHPLPADLNVQVLANLGYLQSATQALPRDLGAINRVSHSPTSSFSDFGGPSTPSDMAGSAESYFSKGMRRESSHMYPTFNIYPGQCGGKSQSPGLLGMHMNPPSVGNCDENGMQMDGMEEQAAPRPVHGDHCKAIPQLHVRSEPGVSSELWAFCPDCGTRSKVDSPPVSDALSYSP